MGNSKGISDLKKTIAIPQSMVSGMVAAQRTLDGMKPTIEYASSLYETYYNRLADILNLRDMSLGFYSPQFDPLPSTLPLDDRKTVSPNILTKDEAIEIGKMYGLTKKETIMFKILVNSAEKFVPTKHLVKKVGVTKGGLRQLKCSIKKKLVNVGISIESDRKGEFQTGRYSISLLTR